MEPSASRAGTGLCDLGVGLGFRVYFLGGLGLGFRLQGLGWFRVQRLGFQGLGFRVRVWV